MDTLTRSRVNKAASLLREVERDAEAMYDSNYNLSRLLYGLREHAVQRLAPHEYSRSEKIADAIGRQPHPGYAFVPVDLTPRDLTVTSSPGGGVLVSTDVAPGNTFVDYLHASSALIKQQISRLALVGNAAFPKVSGKISTFWLSTEGTNLTESQFAFAVEASAPKSVGGYCEVSDLWLKQTSAAAQTFVLRELGRAVAAELDAKLLTGSGTSGEPTGLLNVSGIGSVSGTSLAYAGILDVIKNVEDANGIVDQTRAGFVLAPDAARLLRSREKAAGSGMIMDGYTLANLPAQVTKSVPNGAMVFGDWSQMVLCEWGILEIGMDPFGVNSALFTKGLVGLRALWSCDPVVLHVESFNKVQSIT